jgi:hypothetical protein
VDPQRLGLRLRRRLEQVTLPTAPTTQELLGQRPEGRPSLGVKLAELAAFQVAAEAWRTLPPIRMERTSRQ